jgi:hypothetical protein
VRTEDLIDDLARAPRPVGGLDVEWRMLAAAALGMVVALAALLLWLGVRPDIAAAVATGPFWMKLAYTLAVATASIVLACRMARPDEPGGVMWIVTGAPFVIALVMAAAELGGATAASRSALWLGSSWTVCSARILALSIPTLLAVVWTMRHLAPTRLRLAGFAAGLAAGGVGATVYALTCRETTAAFLATWYALGILAPACLGALLGSRLLRW